MYPCGWGRRRRKKGGQVMGRGLRGPKTTNPDVSLVERIMSPPGRGRCTPGVGLGCPGTRKKSEKAGEGSSRPSPTPLHGTAIRHLHPESAHDDDTNERPNERRLRETLCWSPASTDPATRMRSQLARPSGLGIERYVSYPWWSCD